VKVLPNTRSSSFMSCPGVWVRWITNLDGSTLASVGACELYERTAYRAVCGLTARRSTDGRSIAAEYERGDRMRRYVEGKRRGWCLESTGGVEGGFETADGVRWGYMNARGSRAKTTRSHHVRTPMQPRSLASNCGAENRLFTISSCQSPNCAVFLVISLFIV